MCDADSKKPASTSGHTVKFRPMTAGWRSGRPCSPAGRVESDVSGNSRGSAFDRDGRRRLLTGEVGFGGIRKKVCLAYTPEAAVGDYVLVHVGFAISKLDSEEAGRIFRELEALGAVEELEQETAE